MVGLSSELAARARHAARYTLPDVLAFVFAALAGSLAWIRVTETLLGTRFFTRFLLYPGSGGGGPLLLTMAAVAFASVPAYYYHRRYRRVSGIAPRLGIHAAAFATGLIFVGVCFASLAVVAGTDIGEELYVLLVFTLVVGVMTMPGALAGQALARRWTFG